MRMNIPSDCFVVGNKLMSVCGTCNKIIRVDKPVLGSLHICLSDEEIASRRETKQVSIEDVAKRFGHDINAPAITQPMTFSKT